MLAHLFNAKPAARSFFFALALLAAPLFAGCLAEEASPDEDGQAPPTAEADAPLAGGSTDFPDSIFGSVDRAIGEVQRLTCGATLISEHAALTAAHCVCDDIGPGADLSKCLSRATFYFPDGLGLIGADVVVHPDYGKAERLAFDYAILRLDASYRTAVSAPDVVPVPVLKETLSAGQTAYLVGYGGRGDSCEIPADWQRRWASLPIDSVTEDTDYRFRSSTIHGCGGDSGGPVLRLSGGKLHVAGVASWISDGGVTAYQSTPHVYDWILEHSSRKDLPGDTWGQCVYYRSYGDGDYYSTQGDASSFAGTYARFDNSISQVWIKKGHEATLYDGAGYSGELRKLNGFVGGACNEFGCLHDLSGTSANDRASSIRCGSALPQGTWGHCVYYDRFGDGGYLSTQNSLATFADTNAYFNNKITDVWVKKGYKTSLFAREQHQDRRGTFTGRSGAWCNAYGCLHDLSGSLADDITSSVTCTAE